MSQSRLAPIASISARALSVAIMATLACGGEPTGGNAHGVVQLSNLLITPHDGANCGIFASAPDSIVTQVHVVNTIYVTAVGVHLIVARASDPADVGRVGRLPSQPLPWTPNPAVVRSGDGDVVVRVLFPTAPLCQMRSAYKGSMDFYVSVHIFTTTGEYASPYESFTLLFKQVT
ncbi:MAG TPA: hypothetical protein VE967_07115 [Gemmatimonadaceae bacterium]|nr:hypothetical protein [Gemmatimonadaceae bacterium]